MHVHACHGWHTWGGMVSVGDLTQDKQPVLDSTTNQRSLLVRSRWPVLNGRENQTTAVPARRQFRAGSRGRAGSPSSSSEVVVSRRRCERQRACCNKKFDFVH